MAVEDDLQGCVLERSLEKDWQTGSARRVTEGHGATETACHRRSKHEMSDRALLNEIKLLILSTEDDPEDLFT